MKAVILVGGEGTRLRPISLMMPKPVVPVANVPLIFYIFEWLIKHGVDEAIMVACYLPDLLKKVIGETYKGMKVTYIYEEAPLGTGGAIKRAQKMMKGTTLVINGDVVTDFDITKMYKFHKEKKSRATIGLYLVKNYSAFGVVETTKEGEIKRFLEKPSKEELGLEAAEINAGVYLLEPEVLDIMQEGVKYSIERDVFPKLTGKSFYGFAQNDIYWLDLGTSDKLRKFTKDVLEERYVLKLHSPGYVVKGAGSKVAKNSVTGTGVKLGTSTEIGELTVIGNNVSIGNQTSINNSIVFDNVKIGSGCVIENAIICSGSIIGDNSVIEDNSIIAPDSRVAAFTKLKS
ncbi:MAG: NDP-sugar synthase [Candidatus Firestonebacteria bacterium]